MTSRSIVLIGAPDSGKTNYVGRLWASIKRRKGALLPVGMPENIDYVDRTVQHLMSGSFAPRSDRNIETGRQDFSVNVRTYDDGPISDLVVPDISGELWKNAIEESELPSAWLAELEKASGAIVFVRVHSDQNVQPADWVTAYKLLKLHGDDESPKKHELPTQVLLCELLRHLNRLLSNRPGGAAPRIALIVSAWDRLDQERQRAGPLAFLQQEFPLLRGRLLDPGRLDIKVFGLSVVDGDFDDDEEFREKFLGNDIAEMGSVVTMNEHGKIATVSDVTLPISWLIGD